MKAEKESKGQLKMGGGKRGGDEKRKGVVKSVRFSDDFL